MSRILLFDNLVNTRDLGGIAAFGESYSRVEVLKSAAVLLVLHIVNAF